MNKHGTRGGGSKMNALNGRIDQVAAKVAGLRMEVDELQKEREFDHGWITHLVDQVAELQRQMEVVPDTVTRIMGEHDQAIMQKLDHVLEANDQDLRAKVNELMRRVIAIETPGPRAA